MSQVALLEYAGAFFLPLYCSSFETGLTRLMAGTWLGLTWLSPFCFLRSYSTWLRRYHFASLTVCQANVGALGPL